MKRLLAPALVILVAALAGQAAAAAASEEVAILKTPYGEIAWRFFEKEAPGHTAYVKELIRRGFYEGTTFHRVIPRFVIQGGDPNSKNDDRSDDGWGEADRTLKAEFSQTLHYRPGTVGMARDADPDSGSCQFFIALENIPRLDGRYTIFGEVVEGLQVARRIALLPRDLNDNPLERVTINPRLETRDLPGAIVSAEPGESGELLTGPGRRPRFYDPGDVLWQAPSLASGVPAAEAVGAALPKARIEVTVDREGRVIDARFPDWRTPSAILLLGHARRWSFGPVLYDGEAQKVRFEIDAGGGAIGPPTGGGAPLEISGEISAPRAAVRVELPSGKEAPEERVILRLTVDAEGNVTDAALQSGSGDPELDTAAVEAARKLAFTPASRSRPGGEDPEPVAVYLDVEARFVEATEQ
jgi:peptidyl-prolyl cis-trans isomerase B (cyclophilin B)